ncbi:bifunctional folylpolyglutamate synthase/dihydrofolate synthase [Edaphobacter albus]|uniref:bifunctional folylpolyglutamate synthase/dihydrofolate synthase n=1 Tax=Edaphobacter sp. 4G125 TaxID=2763071 RepID=UPI0016494E19|nr:folylpolyglutamate synthase/dihydrofolate synthase family protein [Edaphobacter sp. 4G125]QNI37043.1 bifunctional folylpolyglutamate synthase/dihydrofolate synthase [Edaphobacter sp. 4G125]
MSYTAAVDHLYARGLELASDSSLPPGKRHKFDLEHMRILARALGNPQDCFPSILIAGTNGKGSTAATLASILAAAGYRTALYTSPHLSRVNERIQIDGRPISDDDFARLYFQVDSTAGRLVTSGELPQHPSFFETLTALAFLYFAEAGKEAENAPQTPSALRAPVDIAVLEVGLGGRLDATNIVTPLLSIITDISLDHQEYLGNTIAEITREKAGILRPRGTLITLPQHPEANQAIGEVAAELGIHAINAASYIPHTPVPQNARPSTSSEFAPEAPFAMRVAPRNRYNVTLEQQPLHVDSPLWGQHQQRNIALAIAGAKELRNPTGYNIDNRNSSSYKIKNTQIETGIRNTRWPGRLEVLPLPNSAPILLDVAHNPAGAWTLRAALSQLPEDLPRTLIFSCLRDKDLREMSQILLPLFDSSSPDRPHDHILFAPINSPRAASLDDLAATARDLEIPAETTPSLTEALAHARAITPSNGLIVATGSVYLIGELRAQVVEATT